MKHLLVTRDFSFYAKQYRKGTTLSGSIFGPATLAMLMQTGKIKEIDEGEQKFEHNLPIESVANPDMGLEKMGEPEELAESRKNDANTDSNN